MIKRQFLIFLLVTLIFMGGASAYPYELWNKTFGGTDYDAAESVRQTSDGGYILAGDTRSFGAGSYDVWLIKTDTNGDRQWNKTFGGTSLDEGRSVQQTSDGGYILAGDTRSFGAGNYDAWLIKTDANGNEKWNKTFGETDYDEARSVRQTSDDGYILAGYTGSFGAGNYDAWLIKTDANGNEQWNKTFGGPGYDYFYSVQLTSDGGYILAGDTGSFGAGNYDAWLIKTYANGDEQWNKTFGGTYNDEARYVQQTPDGGYILAGHTRSFGAGSYDAWLIKTYANGDEQWNKTFGGTDYDAAESVWLTSDGGYILAGDTGSFGAGNYDVWLIKTNANGDEQWNNTFGGTYNDEARSVQQTSDGSYILAGDTYSFGAGDADYWLVKVSTKKPIDSCTVISSPGEYKLTQSIMDSDDPCCIEITSNDVIFDGAGYTIDGDYVSGTNYGLKVVNSTNVTVKNLKLTDWKYGIYYINADKGFITNNSAPSTIRGTGILVKSSNDITLTNNSVSNRTYGIDIDSSNAINLKNNSASNSCYIGIRLTDAFNNTLENNLVASNNTYGIFLANSSFNTLTDNIVASNRVSGIDVRQSNNNTITNNIVLNNSYGINFVLSNASNLRNNIGSHNGRAIQLTRSFNNNLENNLASNNNYGIHLDKSNNNHFTDNTANFNNKSGIFLNNSSSNKFTGNSALGNLEWDFNSMAGSINNDVIYFNIGPMISFTSKDVKIKASSSPASDPSGYRSINKYIESTNNNADQWLSLNVSYNDSDVKDVKENTLQMWKYNGTWSQVSGTNGVNTAQNYVYANITSFSIFAPMADLSPASVTNLHNITYAPTYIKWTWTDPDDADFEKVMVYLDEEFKTNVSRGVQYYHATGLNSSTNYTIDTYTVDNEGNMNDTPVFNTSRTAPSPDIIEPINITIISPADKTIDTTVDVNVTVVLDRAGTVLLNWNGKNESMNGAGTYFYKHKKNILSGNFKFKVYAFDSKGVSNVSETRTLTVNRTIIIDIPIDPITNIVNKTSASIAPSGNVTLTIFNGTNVSGCNDTMDKISLDSKDQLDSELGKKLDENEIFLGENFSVSQNCTKFSQDIQLQFNYTDEQLEAAKIDESNVAVKFYNNTTGKWEDMELYERNEYLNYIKVNVSHFCIFSLVGRVPSPTPSRELDGRRSAVGTSGEAYDNILISETEREYVNIDSEVIYSFDMEGNIVQQIKFKGLTNSGEVAARVEILKNTSTLVENSPPDVIYKNLNILVGTAGWATSQNIAGPTINFRVEKFWVSENNIDESTLRLIRYTDGTWNPLITSKIYEDEDNLYFEGETTEFSCFAVSGKNAIAKAGGLGEEASGEEFPVRTSNEKKPMPGFSLLIGLMSLLITAHILQKKF